MALPSEEEKQAQTHQAAPVLPLTPKAAAQEKRANQARINGALSKGPTSIAGKARSSLNSIRHGLTANEHTLLAMEDPAQYTEVYNAWVDDLRPATKAELRLVEKIVNLDWRLERLAMMDTCVLNMGASNYHQIAARFERIDGIGFIVEGWKDSCSTSQCSDLLRRYMTTLQHQFNSTMRNFRDLEKHRIARTQAGTDIDEVPYQAPRLEAFLNSERVEEPEEPRILNEPPTLSKQDTPYRPAA